jgi:hypothetical protein
MRSIQEPAETGEMAPTRVLLLPARALRCRSIWLGGMMASALAPTATT